MFASSMQRSFRIDPGHARLVYNVKQRGSDFTLFVIVQIGGSIRSVILIYAGGA